MCMPFFYASLTLVPKHFRPVAFMPDNQQAKQQAFAELDAHFKQMQGTHLRDLFHNDDSRGQRFNHSLNGLYIDFSKTHITAETLTLLNNLAHACEMEKKIDAMFNGEIINNTEQRAVLHTALRASKDCVVEVNGHDVVPAVYEQLDRICTFVESIHSGQHTGWTGKRIDTFVNIGIGGSDLGPRMVVDALYPYRHGETSSYFVSNIDHQQVADVTRRINPETTLFIVSSKSFSTLETVSNARSLQQYMLQAGCTAIDKHFIAVSSNIDAAIEFGIDASNIFSIWDWVGGRFSLWSATGLPIALALGFANFRRLLDGAAQMDQHFHDSALAENIPVTMGLLDYWYNNFFQAETHAFVPYDESLRLLPEYLSQLFMESNGKSVDMDNNPIAYPTMPVTWGSTGTNAQHAFFQLLHQGTRMVPVDFLAPLNKQGDAEHHGWLLANCFAQSQALMQGEDASNPHNHFPGNKPSNTILYDELSPEILGMLIALFEHRTYVQGVLWNINSFDQWGVELGKKLAKHVHQGMTTDSIDTETMDSSTRQLIDLYKKKSY